METRATITDPALLRAAVKHLNRLDTYPFVTLELTRGRLSLAGEYTSRPGGRVENVRRHDVSIPTEGQTGKRTAATVNMRVLRGMVRQARSGPVVVAIAKSGRLRLMTDEASASYAGAGICNPDSGSWAFLGEQLHELSDDAIDAFWQARHHVAPESDHRPILTHVAYVNGAMWGTDSYSLYRSECDVDSDRRFFLPGIIGGNRRAPVKNYKPTWVAIHEHGVAWASQGVAIRLKFDGSRGDDPASYPSVAQMWGAQQRHLTFETDRQALLDAVRDAEVRGCSTITLEAKRDALTVALLHQHHDLDSICIEWSRDLPGTGNLTRTGFRPELLRQALRSLRGDTVTVHAGETSLKPYILETDVDAAMVMPVRMS